MACKGNEKNSKDNEEKVGGLNDVGGVVKEYSGQSIREGKKKDIQKISASNTISKSEQNNEKEVSSLRTSTLTCNTNWREYLNRLGSPDNWFLTKEDGEIVNSHHILINTLIYDKIIEDICNRLDERCEREKLYKFLTIRKIGRDLLEWKRLRKDFSEKALDNATQMFTELLRFVSSSLCCIQGNPINKANVIAVITLIWGIWRLYVESKINESMDFGRGWLRNDEFCLSGCNDTCDIRCVCECCGRDINDCSQNCKRSTNILREDIATQIKQIDKFFEFYLEFIKDEMMTYRQIFRDTEFMKQYLLKLAESKNT